MADWLKDEALMWASLEADCSPTNLVRASDWAAEHGLDNLAYTFLWMAAYEKYPEVYNRPGLWHWTDSIFVKLPGPYSFSGYLLPLTSTYFREFKSCVEELSDFLSCWDKCRLPSHLDLVSRVNTTPGEA